MTRRNVGIAASLAVLAALGIVLPAPAVAGMGPEDSPSALLVAMVVAQVVGGLFFVWLLVRIAGGRGWGPPGAPPITRLGPVEILVVAVVMFLLQSAAAGLGTAIGGAGSLSTFLSQCIVSPIVVVFAWFGWRQAHAGGDDVPMVRRSSVARDAAWGVTLALASLPLLAGAERLGGLALSALDLEPVAQDVVMTFRTSDLVTTLVGLVFVVVVAPVIEEVVFRGYLFTGLRRVTGPAGAAVLSAALFAAIHASAYATAPLFALGLVLALIYERTGSLISPIAVHATFNALQFLVILLGRPEAAG